MTTMSKLAADWNAIDSELQALWEGAGKTMKPKAWLEVSGPLQDRHRAIQDELAPLVLEYARAEKLCANHWLFGFITTPDCAKKVREHTGLKPPKGSKIVSQLLRWAEGEEHAREQEEFVRTTPEAEWNEWMDNFCTTTTEGEEAKESFRVAREKLWTGTQEVPA